MQGWERAINTIYGIRYMGERYMGYLILQLNITAGLFPQEANAICKLSFLHIRPQEKVGIMMP